MTKFDGVGLGHIWHTLNDKTRENLIKQYIDMQREITHLNTTNLPYPHISNWSDILKLEFDKAIDRLKGRDIISSDQISQAYNRLSDCYDLFKNNKIYPVFWDIHLDNAMVTDDGELTGFIDFEHIVPATLDYPLFALKRLVYDPKRYATEENEDITDPKDYTKVWQWYENYYPEMFDFEHLEQRIKIYQLLDILRLLDEWSHNIETVHTFEDLIV